MATLNQRFKLGPGNARCPVVEPEEDRMTEAAARRCRTSPFARYLARLSRWPPPRNKGLRYPADPPTVEEIVAVMRAAGDRAHGQHLRGLVVVLWRAGLRIHEALALAEADLDHRRGSLLVRRGKGGRRREVGMDAWAWEQLEPWMAVRINLPVGRLLCVTRARPADGHGQALPHGLSSVGPRRLLGCADGSRRTSSATLTPSRWPMNACRAHRPAVASGSAVLAAIIPFRCEAKRLATPGVSQLEQSPDEPMPAGARVADEQAGRRAASPALPM
jgi:hypothetical protein